MLGIIKLYDCLVIELGRIEKYKEKVNGSKKRNVCE